MADMTKTEIAGAVRGAFSAGQSAGGASDLSAAAQLLIKTGGELAVGKGKVEFVERPDDPDGGYVVTCGGALLPEAWVPGPTPRAYEAHSLKSFVDLVAHFAVRNQHTDIAEERAAGKSVAELEKEGGLEMKRRVFVFVGGVRSPKVVALLEERDRRETITFELRTSATYQRVKALTPSNWLEQADMVDVLKREIRSERLEPATIIKTVSNITWSRSEDGGAEISQGVAGFRNATMAKVTGAAEVPEVVSVSVPVFDNVTFGTVGLQYHPVACSFDVNATTRRLRMVAMAGELARAETNAAEEIAEYIGEQLSGLVLNGRVNVFLGTVGD